MVTVVVTVTENCEGDVPLTGVLDGEHTPKIFRFVLLSPRGRGFDENRQTTEDIIRQRMVEDGWDGWPRALDLSTSRLSFLACDRGIITGSIR